VSRGARITGDGPAVVLLHGGTGSPESYWVHQLPVLSEHFTVVTMDYHGFGQPGSAGSAGRFSIVSTAADLVGLLDESGIESAHLVGLSLGGAIALQTALDHPARVRRLVLADTFSGVRTERFARFLDFVLIESLRRGGHDLMFEINAIFAFSEQYLHDHRGDLASARSAWRQTDVERYVQALQSVREWSVDDRLGEVRSPALVLWGSEDIELPRVYSQRLADGLPHAMLSIIDGAGHKSCAERPEAFNKAVLAFLLDTPEGR
jgi:pimeloyl-ACP methyl ester carboxylesterase